MGVWVLGAGIAGLTSAIALAHEGRSVTIRAADRTPETTSDVAAAVWYPFLAQPREDVVAWSRATYEVLREHARIDGTGVDVAPIVELFDEAPGQPWWVGAGPEPRTCTADGLPGSYEHGWQLEVPVAEMGRYLAWLERQAEALGVSFEEERVEDLDEALAETEVLVNATGLGARELVGDATVTPVRGHVVHVEDPGLERGYIDQSTSNAIAYAVPVGERVVLGGTAQEGEAERGWPEGVVERILAVNRSIEPRLRDARVLERKVGLRPYRSPIRLEAEQRTAGTVVHNYGHGGSGVTVAWGCAEAVRERVAAALGQASTSP